MEKIKSKTIEDYKNNSFEDISGFDLLFRAFFGSEKKEYKKGVISEPTAND